MLQTLFVPPVALELLCPKIPPIRAPAAPPFLMSPTLFPMMPPIIAPGRVSPVLCPLTET